MSILAPEAPRRATVLGGELAKLAAFARRDLKVALSYRMSFVSDLVGMAGQIVVFYFVSRLVDQAQLRRYTGTDVTYIQFAAVGIGIAVFVEFGLHHVSQALRSEQLMGTLDSLLITPTLWVTIQVGSVAFELLFVLIRMTVFVASMAVVFGLGFKTSGILPSLVVLLAFAPFVWGLGVIAGAVVLTFRRGGGFVGLGSFALALGSGLYFPTQILPHWLAATADWNPLALVTRAVRESLLTGGDWSAVGHKLAVVVPLSLAALAAGAFCFHLAVQRERRLGTLGLY